MMKVCCECDNRFDANDWTCPECGEEPTLHDTGIPMFAPSLATSGEGVDPAAFDELAELEEGYFWFRARNRVVTWALRRYFPDLTSLFELGCGNGYVLKGIRNEFPDAQLVAGDLYCEGLEYARQRVPEASAVQVDGRALPFDQHFDVTCAFDVLEHIDDDLGAACSMFDSIRPGGGIVVTVPQHQWLWSAADDYARHCRRYTRRTLSTLLTDAGFEVIRITSFATTVLPLMVASRARNRRMQASYDPWGEFRLARPVNATLERLMDADRILIRAGARLPAGGSLLAVGRRPH
jgi:SAM-dependent methyltransferase